MRSLDVALSEWVVDGRTSFLTPVMTFLSLWWVKDLLGPLVALAIDVRRRERPWRFGLVLASTLLASWACSLLKGVVDRTRPATQGLWSALVDVPSSASFPSGHATTAFAAAVALGLLVPRLRVIALVLAAAVACSRVYLGVHFVGDVTAGALLGSFVAWSVVTLGRSGPRNVAHGAPTR